ncbi:unnamed protein product, partial [Ectocarpus fasciculatus]
MMQWPELCVSLVLALSLSPAAGFVTSNPFLSWPQQPAHSSPAAPAAAPAAAHSGPASILRRPAPRLLLCRPPSTVLLRPRCSRIYSLSADSAARSPTRAAGFCSVQQSLDGGVGQRRRLGGSNTALELAASSNGVGEEGGSGADSDKGGGWRQRMVRTIVFVVMRIRAMAAGLGAMLGLGRWTKRSSSSNQSLFSSAGGKKAAAGKSRGRLARGLSRLFKKRTVTVLVAMLFVFGFARGFRSGGTPSVTEVPMSTFMQLMEGKRGADVVESVRVSKTGTMFFKMNGRECYTLPLRVSKEVFKALCNSGIPFRATKSPPGLSFIFPVAYLLAVYYFIVKRGQGSMVGSTGKLASSTELDTSLTFGDVAGVDQAKSQVQ